ncbi:hypothetical protein Zmor_004636 [Zophobas morio]|uniref:Zinc finger PHD-type domain-containing protein n=1 Tax=Zophobas morio TaxID=2755281 RepID=A0AA38IRR6_9CUCU|nr:hypothetical protein Zmor_004636 [Zophobas morio]
MSGCNLCNKKTRATECVTCDICRKLVHTECARLSDIEIECLKSKSRVMHYYCDKCDIISTINCLKEEIRNLKLEVSELKNKNDDNELFKKSTDKIASGDIDVHVVEDELITEIMDRQSRANNLIIYNLPESTSSTDGERKHDDTTSVMNLIGEQVISEESLRKLRRIGSKNTRRIRPLLMTVSSSADVINILRNYRTKNNVYINRDLTVKQRNLSFAVRKDFKQRCDNGEKDIKLKYFNGIPKIVSVTQENNRKNINVPSE